MENWRVELGTKDIKIQRDIFQETHYRHYYFLTTTMLLNYMLRKWKRGDKSTKLEEKINYLVLMDDIKIFPNNKKELETLIETSKMYNEDTGNKVWD